MRFFIPVLFLAGLLALLLVGLKHDPREVPSPLIGKPAPAISLHSLEGDSTKLVNITNGTGRPILVNFFASWCEGCREEHPKLMQLAANGVEIIGIDYKDTNADVSAFLKQHGNPYRSVLLDHDGAVGLDFGVYGVPETYVIDPKGIVLFKQTGAITNEAWEQKIRPLLTAQNTVQP